MSRHSLTILVGAGSTQQDLGAACLMIVVTSSTTGEQSVSRVLLQSDGLYRSKLTESSCNFASSSWMRWILSEKKSSIQSHNSLIDLLLGGKGAFFIFRMVFFNTFEREGFIGLQWQYSLLYKEDPRACNGSILLYKQDPWACNGGILCLMMKSMTKTASFHQCKSPGENSNLSFSISFLF